MNSRNIPYNAKIDHLRWLAATVVFLFHFHLEFRAAGGPGIASPWLGIVTEGHTGVGLFFSLSGFLFMQIALFQQKIDYGAFIRNRCLRILPLFLTIFMVATSISRDKFIPQDLLYVLVSNLGKATTSDTVITGAAWTISIEFTFYLLFPFLAKFTLERGAVYLVKLLVLMLFFKLAAFTVTEKSSLMYFSTLLGRFDQFLVGMLAALVYRRYAHNLHRIAAWLLPCAAAAVVCNSALQTHVARFEPASHSVFWIYWSLLEAAGWCGLILAWVSYDKKPPAWLDKVLLHGGKISFSFYMLHMAMLHLLAKTFGLPVLTGLAVVDAALTLLLAYAATWAIATLSYSAIEAPFLNMRRNYGTKTDPVSQP